MTEEDQAEKYNGFTLWFTGLPSSGKSTVAKEVENELRRKGLKVENLDADGLRKNLHPDLGFTKEERGTNNKRIGFISKLLTKNDITTIVAAVSPFKEYRQVAREYVEEEGEFYQVYVECPVDVCKERDPKGLYDKAERGIIPNFTGVSHPFEEPTPDEYDMKVNTAELDPDSAAEKVLQFLSDEGVFSSVDEYTGLNEHQEEEIKDRLKRLGYL
ncbi:MAG: adenylyl-sulfate kinase [Candidatus Bipolaricaulota bacterium]|nr:adenylyl-sulfate kinase [Candidatus Bipolaricaulota bacterium]